MAAFDAAIPGSGFTRWRSRRRRGRNSDERPPKRPRRSGRVLQGDVAVALSGEPIRHVESLLLWGQIACGIWSTESTEARAAAYCGTDRLITAWLQFESCRAHHAFPPYTRFPGFSWKAPNWRGSDAVPGPRRRFT